MRIAYPFGNNVLNVSIYQRILFIIGNDKYSRWLRTIFMASHWSLCIIILLQVNITNGYCAARRLPAFRRFAFACLR